MQTVKHSKGLDLECIECFLCSYWLKLFIFSTKADKAYDLEVDSRKLKVFCRMTDVTECGGGAWTLVMKIDCSEVGMAGLSVRGEGGGGG